MPLTGTFFFFVYFSYFVCFCTMRKTDISSCLTGITPMVVCHKTLLIIHQLIRINDRFCHLKSFHNIFTQDTWQQAAGKLRCIDHIFTYKDIADSSFTDLSFGVDKYLFIDTGCCGCSFSEYSHHNLMSYDKPVEKSRFV